MTDDTDLIARLRLSQTGGIHYEAAAALEAQARRISELEDKLKDEEYVSKDTNEMFHEVRDENIELRARIAELEATIRKFQLVEKALNYFLDKDTPHTWRYRRDEAEELARAALGEKDADTMSDAEWEQVSQLSSKV